MARSDAAFQASTLPAEVRTSLRVAPLSFSSVFGPALRSSIKSQADVQRDAAVAFLPALLTQHEFSKKVGNRHYSQKSHGGRSHSSRRQFPPSVQD